MKLDFNHKSSEDTYDWLISMKTQRDQALKELNNVRLERDKLQAILNGLNKTTYKIEIED